MNSKILHRLITATLCLITLPLRLQADALYDAVFHGDLKAATEEIARHPDALKNTERPMVALIETAARNNDSAIVSLLLNRVIAR